MGPFYHNSDELSFFKLRALEAMSAGFSADFANRLEAIKSRFLSNDWLRKFANPMDGL